MRRRQSRIRPVLKWVGLVACLLAVSVGTISCFWDVAYVRRWGPSEWIAPVEDDWGRQRRPPESHVCVTNGVVVFAWFNEGSSAGPMGWSFYRAPHFEVRWLPRLTSYPRVGMVISLPPWVMLAATAVPTLILWWHDRRYPKGHCQSCGYDLSGNVSGVCPECGTKL